MIQLFDKIAVFRFRGHVLDVYGTKERPLFVAIQLARMIDYSYGSTNKMLDTVPYKDKLTGKLFWSGQMRTIWFVTEAGLYRILMRSSKPIAEEFQDFIIYELIKLRTDRGEAIETFAHYAEQVLAFCRVNERRSELYLPELSFDEYLELIDQGVDLELWDPIF